MNTNGNAVAQEDGAGTDYGGNEETAALLGRPPPVVVAAVSQGKPVLTRQDRATFLVASPQLSVSGLGGSEESGTNEDPATRSVPDIELHCRLDGEPQPSPPPPPPQIQQPIQPQQQQSQLQALSASYGSRSSRQSHQYRCRCDRRDSLAPTSALHLARSVSRESVKSGHHCCPCQAPPPPVLVTTSPNARIIRQSSQPEASACCCSGCCCPLHTGAAPSAASLRQLREPGDGIAGIAADSLRINGGIRQFRQFPWWWCKSSSSTMTTAAAAAVPSSSTAAAPGTAASGSQGGQGVVLCPRTLSQVRRSRLRRALTEATAETVNYVKTVGDDDFSLIKPCIALCARTGVAGDFCACLSSPRYYRVMKGIFPFEIYFILIMIVFENAVERKARLLGCSVCEYALYITYAHAHITRSATISAGRSTGMLDERV